jgi:hypothetical protein
MPENLERIRSHIETMSKWLELEQRLSEGKSIDYENQLHIQEAKKHWF